MAEVTPSANLPVCVFDTGVALQAVLNPRGPAGQALQFLDKIVLYLSPRLRAEMEEVLFRPSLRTKFDLLTDDSVIALLQRLDTVALMVPNAPLYFSLPRDRKDEPIVNLAIHVRADYLVSRDKDLLDLNANAVFKQAYPFLQIVDPVAFCAAMTTLSNLALEGSS